ncbi:dynein light chain Tctex-type protein 2B-like [Branchiostoma floridae x Branchiostoma japonicum]
MAGVGILREEPVRKKASVPTQRGRRAWSPHGKMRPRSGTWHGDEELPDMVKNARKLTDSLATEVRFDPGLIQDVIEMVLTETLAHETYAASKMGVMSKRVSDVLKTRIRGLCGDRFKLVCIVVITEGGTEESALHVTSQCVWDHERDDFASGSFSNDALHAVATVFAIHC